MDRNSLKREGGRWEYTLPAPAPDVDDALFSVVSVESPYLALEWLHLHLWKHPARPPPSVGPEFQARTAGWFAWGKKKAGFKNGLKVLLPLNATRLSAPNPRAYPDSHRRRAY